MTQFDSRGCRVSGATPAALAAYEHALSDFLSWRSGAAEPLDLALAEAPGFAMARVLQAYMRLGSRDPRRVREAGALLAATTGLPANAYEQRHLAVIARVLADDYRGAVGLLGEALAAQPRDLLALAVAHGFDYLTGEIAHLRDRIESVLPAWPTDLPGYHSVRAMHAFGLAECGDYEHAEEAACAALGLNENDARAHHAMAHVFEMTDRPDAGVRWLNAHAQRWSVETVVATHGWWHLALFHLACGEVKSAMALYDGRIRAGGSLDVADLIDATALLWRLHLRGVDTGTRWNELSAAWEPHIEDGFCSFSDLHAMLAFVGARDWTRAQRLEHALVLGQLKPTRYGETTRQLGLPGCSGLVAFGRGNHPMAIALLGSLPTQVHRLGGSHAQRDVLHLTLLQAIERIRRPAHRPSTLRLPGATHETRRAASRNEAATPAP
ncbi:tetratricopeptide repeat protein [Variovorax sp. J22G21]|uniref:tetratricopeptide repeat protein n=1 Tax=Variovorax fucosicus TaxID=3053517 RepID=UPI0025781F2B|nr:MULTISPECIES: tetratricopeptide repeat protein [unclassified Variovorax]MDM0041191.1 tetratricopeptide repeat protein [Variovorax sp. J22R193]MDM0060248.1 tetratricopeptide repeat protein [Variovorax sp. J22G21]